jgi:hypothetical protein
MKRILPLLLVLAAAAPVPLRLGSAPRIVEGHYRISWETQAFTACGARESWWMNHPGALARHWPKHVDGNWGVVYARVLADVSGEGQFGHMGSFPRTVAVHLVLDVRPAREGDCEASGTRGTR